MWQVIKSNPTAVLALLVSSAAFVFSWISFKKTRSAALYSDIDGRYLELLKLGIANPNFVNPALTKDYKEKFHGNDLLKYERYAFAAWNIVETIFDRREVEDVRVSWDPVIREENRLHRTWLNNKENQDKFKRSFLNFIGTNFPCPTCLEMESLCTGCEELQR